MRWMARVKRARSRGADVDAGHAGKQLNTLRVSIAAGSKAILTTCSSIVLQAIEKGTRRSSNRIYDFRLAEGALKLRLDFPLLPATGGWEQGAWMSG